MINFRGEFIISETITRGQRIIHFLSTGEDDAVDFMDDKKFFNALNDKVNLARVGVSKGIHGFTLESLSQKWLISQEEARRTVHHTTQQGIRIIIYPYLSRQFKTNDRALRYNKLQQNVFTYTI